MQLDDAQANEKIFGGKIVVLGGDFRQILSIIPKGEQEDIVSASLPQSLVACYDSLSSYQHASHGSQF
jgi:ATP-dependent DNA helicase PIF1